MSIIKAITRIGAAVAVVELIEAGVYFARNEGAVKRTIKRAKDFIFKKKDEESVEIVIEEVNENEDDTTPTEDLIKTATFFLNFFSAITLLKSMNKLWHKHIHMPIVNSMYEHQYKEHLWSTAYTAQLETVRSVGINVPIKEVNANV